MRVFEYSYFYGLKVVNNFQLNSYDIQVLGVLIYGVI